MPPRTPRGSTTSLRGGSTVARRGYTVDLRDFAEFDPTGGSSSSTALAAAVAQAADGDTIQLGAPNAEIVLTAPWVIDKNVRVIGGGARELWGSSAAELGGDLRHLNIPGPVAAGRPLREHVTGTRLVQTLAGADVIQIPTAGTAVDLEGFALGWHESIRWTNTGHGIYAVAPATPVAGGGTDSGLMSSKWRDLIVFGHAGTKYGFFLKNPMYNSFHDCRSLGGGGWYVECDSFLGNYGNCVWHHPFSQMLAGGTADIYRFMGRAGGATGKLNFLQWNRPQAAMLGGGLTYGAPAVPTNAQYLWYMGDHVYNYSVVAGDLETSISGATIRLANQDHWVDPSSWMAAAGTFWIASDPREGTRRTQANGIIEGTTGRPITAAAGAQAGTGAPAPAVLSGSDDMRGQVSFGTGTGPAAGAMVVVSWSATKGGQYFPVLTPLNAATAALGLHIAGNTTTGFTVGALSAPTAAQANTTYAFTYQATG